MFLMTVQQMVRMNYFGPFKICKVRTGFTCMPGRVLAL